MTYPLSRSSLGCYLSFTLAFIDSSLSFLGDRSSFCGRSKGDFGSTPCRSVQRCVGSRAPGFRRSSKEAIFHVIEECLTLLRHEYSKIRTQIRIIFEQPSDFGRHFPLYGNGINRWPVSSIYACIMDLPHRRSRPYYDTSLVSLGNDDMSRRHIAV